MPGAVESGLRRLMLGSYGLLIVTVACAAWASLATWSVHDPSLNNATRAMPRNVLGSWGAVLADLAIQSLGLAAIILFLPLAAWGWHLVFRTDAEPRRMRLLAWPCSVDAAGGGAGRPAPAEKLAAAERPRRHFRRFLHGRRACDRPVPARCRRVLRGRPRLLRHRHLAAAVRLRHQHLAAHRALGAAQRRCRANGPMPGSAPPCTIAMHTGARMRRLFGRSRREARSTRSRRGEPTSENRQRRGGGARARRRRPYRALVSGPTRRSAKSSRTRRTTRTTSPRRTTASPASTRTARRKEHTGLSRAAQSDEPYEAPSIKLLQQAPRASKGRSVSDEVLQENARELEGVLQDFGVKGEITNVRPGPVVTLYELEPAPGTKSSRVIGLADDIARSMSAVADPRRRGAGPQRHRHRAPQRPARDRDAARDDRIAGLPGNGRCSSRSRSARISAASRSSSISRACRIS